MPTPYACKPSYWIFYVDISRAGKRGQAFGKRESSCHNSEIHKINLQRRRSLKSSHATFIMELNDLYSSPNIVRVIKSRRMRWAGHVARMEEGRGVHKVLVEKPEGKRPLGRPRRRWEDNIKMDLQEVGRGCGGWLELAQDRDRWRALVSTVMNFRVY